MAAIDAFTSSIFEMTSLTDAIRKLPYTPGKVGRLGIFEDKGIATTTLLIDEKDGVLYLVPTAHRGGTPNLNRSGRRKARTFEVTHIPLEDSVLPDDVTNIRKFGSENELEAVADVVNDKLQEMKNNIQVTKEYLMLGALKGQILDADGTTIYDLFTEFGVTQTEVNFELGTSSTKVRLKCMEVKRAIEDAMGGSPFGQIHCFCGKDFFDSLISHSDVETAYARWRDGEMLRNDPRAGFPFAGLVFEEYRGTVSGVQFVEDDEAHFFPINTPGLYKMYYGPADFNETANTIGLDLYAKSEARKFNRGVDLHVQTNPLPLCNRPNALVLGTEDTPSPSPSPSAS